jgi:polyhydroxybutyrate depolymerase
MKNRGKISLLMFTLLLLANVHDQEVTPEPTSESTPEAAAPAFPQTGSYTITKTIGGIERSYRIFIPETYDEAGEPVPLVIVLHGAGGTGAWIESFSGFNDLTSTENFIAVYPEGVNNVWNDGRRGDVRVGNIDDVNFISEIIDFLSANLNIDPQRVYATGYSMGGMLAFRLGCELRDKIAAIATVATTFPEYLLPNCVDAAPIPILVIHGTDDPVVPWQGIRGGYLTAMNTLRYWADRNQCEEALPIEAEPDSDPEDNTRVLRTEYTQCEDSADVILYGIYGGGHTWPGTPFDAPLELGLTSMDIHATKTIWGFFEAHS